MAFGRLPEFFGDDWDDALDSLKSVPGAFGNVLVGASRQFRLIDAAALLLVLGGWLWLIVGFGVLEDHRPGLMVLALIPTVLWLVAGIVAGLIFEIGGIGFRALAYWEAYLLILLCAALGTVSLRLALNPRDRRVYRGSSAADA